MSALQDPPDGDHLAGGSDSSAGPEGAEGAEGETKGARTRRRLLELAIERFGERGYRSTSVSEIARAGGLTQAAVYAYFDGKEDLFDAAVDADADAVISEIRERLEHVDPRMLIPSFLFVALGSLDAHPLVRRVLAGDEKPALQRLLNLPALGRLTDWLATELRRGQSDGSVRADIDPAVVADGAESLLLGLLMAVVQVGGTHEHRRQVGVLALFDAALRPSG
ncbi:MAG: TetR/AcrR family transcriptional regulator [Acidimicrobiia bacterium]|nr:TetR/AcrR family transcriptional regulator [Acidimicrobiia bacterium]